MIDLLQYIGTAILILHKFPQIYTAYKERDQLKGFSLVKFGMGIVGGIFMGVWALAKGNWGVVALNIFCIAYESSIFILIFRLKRKKKKSIDFLEYFKKVF